MTRMMGNANRIREFGRNSREMFEKGYTFDVFEGNLIQVLHDEFEKNRPGT